MIQWDLLIKILVEFVLAISIEYCIVFLWLWIADLVKGTSDFKPSLVLILLEFVLIFFALTFFLKDSEYFIVAFSCALILGVFCCFYALYLIRNNKDRFVFLIGMFITAILIHIVFMFFLAYSSMQRGTSYEDLFLRYLPIWFGDWSNSGNSLLLSLKAVSFIYMALFIGLCTDWLASGFKKKESHER